MTIVFLRVLDELDKGSALRGAKGIGSVRRFDRTREQLSEIPGTPFAYWLSEPVRGLFGDSEKFSGSEGTLVRQSKQGLATSDDFRFIRSWFEVEVNPSMWRPIAKGRSRRAFYADIPEVIRWERDTEPARELKAYVMTKPGNTHWSRRIVGVDFYGQPGLTWPVRASKFSPRPLPSESVFSHRGYSAFTDIDDDLMSLVGWGASSIADFLFKASLGRFGFPEFLVGVLKGVPFPAAGPLHNERLSQDAKLSWSLTRWLDSVVETSHSFLRPALLQVAGDSLADRVAAWSARVADAEAELVLAQFRIDSVCFDLYGVSADDQRVITEGFGVRDDSTGGSDEGPSEMDGDEDAVEADPVGLSAGLVSWAAGVSVGRFDVRSFSIDRVQLMDLDPFEPLPATSPAMLVGADGLPAKSPPEQYPIDTSPVLVDDPGHDLDLALRVRRVFEIVFGIDADRWWTEVGTVLDSKKGDVDSWIRRELFDYHLSAYSKPSRPAPIIWRLGTRSASYSVWLYAPQANADSLFRALNDIVGPKLDVEERGLSDLRQEAGPSPSASQRKAIDAQETFVGELREFRDELAAVAPLWAPDLNDGVVIVLAPLWRLFAHHRGWSSELKDRWKKLAVGDYDWAQLAMRLWPERVIPKCAEDRSLAIAHGLEDVFWVADKDNPDKWHLRTIPTTPVEELIAARTNSTITTARQHPTP